MQFPTFITGTIVLLLASSAAAQSGARKCTYATGSYTATCKLGNNIFCGGMEGLCSGGKTESFDSVATKANEAACAGKSGGNGCTQTVRCC
ncbi:hypothetical protein VTL71DRAFT_7833 [Oculimacula yallundae]|uniref:Uncharacterized protein n=1 Tax=Oculimacula yallundae TaxID=86028 RepID=A0ABR4CVZ5_9HELO